jgi:hypothetical protein
MQTKNIFNALLKKGDGIIKASDALQAGIPKSSFRYYADKFNLEKIAYGVYRSNDAWDDGMYLLQARFSKAIFSHQCALYLLGLSDREPLQYTVTVKTNYNYAGLAKEGVKVHSVKEEWLEIGLTTLQSLTGRSLQVYNAERTICDIIRRRKSIEIQDFQTAMKLYAERKNKDLPLLLRYAQTFRVEKTLRQYLEVLL